MSSNDKGYIKGIADDISTLYSKLFSDQIDDPLNNGYYHHIILDMQENELTPETRDSIYIESAKNLIAKLSGMKRKLLNPNNKGQFLKRMLDLSIGKLRHSEDFKVMLEVLSNDKFHAIYTWVNTSTKNIPQEHWKQFTEEDLGSYTRQILHFEPESMSLSTGVMVMDEKESSKSKIERLLLPYIAVSLKRDFEHF